MSGRWRTLRVMLVIGALSATLGLSACASSTGNDLPCELPPDATIVELPDGGYEVVRADGESYRLAFANGTCVAARPFAPAARVERSDDQLRYLYDYYVFSLGPCLDSMGYPFMQPPSRDRFVESGGNWSPYDVVFSSYLSAQDIRWLTTACPHLPGPLPSLN